MLGGERVTVGLGLVGGVSHSRTRLGGERVTVGLLARAWWGVSDSGTRLGKERVTVGQAGQCLVGRE